MKGWGNIHLNEEVYFWRVHKYIQIITPKGQIHKIGWSDFYGIPNEEYECIDHYEDDHYPLQITPSLVKDYIIHHQL
jgi:hypothetical protein